VSFDVLIDMICAAVFAVGDDNKKEREGRKSTQSQKTLYFSYLLGRHPWTDSDKIWHASCTSQRNQKCEFLGFQGFQIYRGSKSLFFHWLCWSSLHQCCATTQPV